jgi:DNA-binding GntR family transcriptional regulator
MYSVAYMLEATARLAAHTGDPERAARLLGAASQMRVAAGVSVWGSQLERRDRFVESLTAELGSDRFASAFEAGSLLDYADAIAETSLAR